MYSHVILADGTEIPEAWVSTNGYNSLWIDAPLTMQAGAELFLQPEKTASIRYRYGENVEQVYVGYTDCQVLNKTPDGLRVLMVKDLSAAAAASPLSGETGEGAAV